MFARAIAAAFRNARTRTELERFHRAEMREAGVTDAEFRRFVNGR